MKRLTGNDTVNAREPYKKARDVRPTWKIHLQTNHYPSVTGMDSGLWRRMKCVQWSADFTGENQDTSLKELLLAKEAEGILAWAVRGAMLWYRSGLAEPGSVSEATESYRDTADILAGFYPDGVLSPGPPGCTAVSLASIFFAFQGWAESEGIETYSRRWLRSNLDTRGVKFVRGKGGMMAKGVVLDTKI